MVSKTMNRQTKKALENERKFFIKKYGWACVYVMGEEDIRQGPPTFSYTVGISSSWGGPEFVLVGFEKNLCHQIFSSLIEKIKRKEFSLPITDGYFSEVIEEFDVLLLAVQRDLAVQLATAAFENSKNKDPNLFQLVMPDRNGYLPDNDKCDPVFADTQNLQNFSYFLNFKKAYEFMADC